MRTLPPGIAAFVLALNFVGPAPAEEFVTVNGLPCGAFCREWMGIASPLPLARRAAVAAPPEDAPDDDAGRRGLRARSRERAAKRASSPRQASRASERRRAAHVRSEAAPGSKRAPTRPEIAAAPEGPRPARAASRTAQSAAAPNPTPAKPETAPPAAVQSAAKDADAAAKTPSPPESGASGQAPSTTAGRRVLIVLANTTINGPEDLNRKPVLIAGLWSVPSAQIKAAFHAAGAGAAELEQGERSDIDELLSGKVAAAIVAAVTPERAAAFPEIDGLRVLRIDASEPRRN